jgi:type VI protein secretion system component VasF
MSDNLEKFINENRSEFDDRQPSKDIWLSIDQALDQKRKKPARRIPIWRYARVAAAAVLLIGTGVVIGLKMNNQTPEPLAFEEVYPEYFEAEQYYQKEVNTKIAQLANYSHDAEINDDLKQLDAIYEELKKELSEAPKTQQEQIINAMITNYRTKLSILERVLERIQSTNQENLKTTNDDSIEI